MPSRASGGGPSRSRHLVRPGSLGTEAEWIDVSRPAPTSEVESSSELDPQPPVAWPARVWGAWSDRRLVFVSLAAMAGLGLVAVMDLLLPPSTSVRLDPGVDGMGRAVPGVSILPFVLIAIAIGSLAAYARQGRWLRRIGVVILVAVVGWALSGVVDQTVPSPLDRDRGWVTGESGEVSYGLDGLTEYVTYRLAPGESFVVRDEDPQSRAAAADHPWPRRRSDDATEPIRRLHREPGLGRPAARTARSRTFGESRGRVRVVARHARLRARSWRSRSSVEPVRARTRRGQSHTVPLNSIDLAYRSLGVRRTAEVGLPAALFLTSKSPCTVEVPGGQVTYSTPGE